MPAACSGWDPRARGQTPARRVTAGAEALPTATDALVVLGRLRAENVLGGQVQIQPGLAAEAVQRELCQPLGLGVEEAALGAVRILTQSMVEGIEISSVQKGYDPRDFALVAAGGAGPVFACDIAQELRIPTVLVPPLSRHHVGAGAAGNGYRVRVCHDRDAVILGA